MPDRKASPKELEPKTSLPLPFETGPDRFSAPETSLKGDQTVVWDRALLRPFVPRGKLNAQPSEAEIFQELIAEGTVYLLYQRIKKKGDSKLQSGWLFLKLQAKDLSGFQISPLPGLSFQIIRPADCKFQVGSPTSSPLPPDPERLIRFPHNTRRHQDSQSVHGDAEFPGAGHPVHNI